MACLNQSEIELLLHSDSKDATVQEFRRHVEDCPECQSRMREMEANEELLHEIQGLFPDGIPSSSGNGLPSGSLRNIAPFLTGTRTDAAHIDIPAGHILNEQYEVVEEVGRGHAIVYRAKCLDRDIALKIIPPEPSLRMDPLQLLAQEWERQDRITSEHVVKAYLPQKSQYEGLPLLVLPMEYASGGSF